MIAPSTLIAPPLKVTVPVVLALPRLTVVATPTFAPLVEPEPISPPRVTPPVPPAAFISREFSLSTVPILPVIEVNPAPERMSMSRAAPVESSFPVIVTAPPPASVVLMVIGAAASTFPVISKTPESLVPPSKVIFPDKVTFAVPALTVTSLISVEIAAKATVPDPEVKLTSENFESVVSSPLRAAPKDMFPALLPPVVIVKFASSLSKTFPPTNPTSAPEVVIVVSEALVKVILSPVSVVYV